MKHARRPRGSQSGRVKRRDERFQEWAEEPLAMPWVPTLTEPSPNGQENAGS